MPKAYPFIRGRGLELWVALQLVVYSYILGYYNNNAFIEGAFNP